MKTLNLSNGREIPKIGFGTFKLGEENKDSIKYAINHGYRLIDTAAMYLNEHIIGEAISEVEIPREELLVSTKLWLQDTGYNNTIKAFNRSLERLNLNYIDIYLLHTPIGDIYGSWKAIEYLYKKGKIKNIGVSNFSKKELEDLIKFSEIKPMINQIEVNVFKQQEKIIKVNNDNNIITQASSPLSSGENNIFNNPTLVNISHRHKKSVSQIAIKWLIEQDISVVPKSVHKSFIKENINVFDFNLSKSDNDKIKRLNAEDILSIDYTDPDIIKELENLKFDI